jgi:hypothetical protein
MGVTVAAERTRATPTTSMTDAMPRCHICGTPIERRYGLTRPRSISQGYWSHLDTVEGTAADNDHEAQR